MNTLVKFAIPLGALCWISVYILMIIKGIKNKTYYMPFVPLIFNISWEFIYSFIIPSKHSLSEIIFIAWFIVTIQVKY